MKYLFCFSFLLLHLTDSFSQNIFPQQIDAPVWKLELYGDLTFETSYLFIELGQDTFACGKQWIQVLYHDTLQNSYYPIGYYRQEGQRVLARTKFDCQTPEYVMYDFSLEAGDTITCGFAIDYFPNPHNTIKLFVTHTDIEYFECIPRKVIYLVGALDIPFATAEHFKWVEGIGDLQHPFYPLECLCDNFEIDYSLASLYTNGEGLIYSNPSQCDSVSVALDEVTKSSLSISPNPVSKYLDINLSNYNHATSFHLISIGGQPIFSCHLDSGQNRVKLENISSGFYIYQLRDSNGTSITTGKLMKN